MPVSEDSMSVVFHAQLYFMPSGVGEERNVIGILYQLFQKAHTGTAIKKIIHSYMSIVLNNFSIDLVYLR